MHTEYDIAVIGGGILGLATARSLRAAYPGTRMVVVEKESSVAMHQSGRNSGVIHSGLYYEPGSLKASLCVGGADQMVRYCRDNGIPHARDGKVVVATSERQVPALEELARRGGENGLEGLRRITPAELADIEPHASAVAALHVPTTGAVDFGAVCEALAAGLHDAGVALETSFRVDHIGVGSDGLTLESGSREIRAGGIVNCAGLYSDRVAEMAGVDPGVRIVPFRGEYFDVHGESAELVRSSIYPVPDPRLPFLGVHLTRSADGRVHAGPNAVLAAAREGYEWRTIRTAELWQTLRYAGFRALARRHWRSGVAEVVRSLSLRRFVASVRSLVPDIRSSDLSKGAAGVRAQAVTPGGKLLDDFLIVDGPRSVHVLNAPSPAATSSLAIGDYIAPRIGNALGIG